MSSASRLAPGLAQRPSLAPALTQSLRLLALPGIELSRVVEAALETNVMIERVETEAAVSPAAWDWNGGAARASGDLSDEAGSEEEDLKTHLLAQLTLERLSERDFTIAEVIVDALDDAGYLRPANDALAEILHGLDPAVTVGEIEMVVHRIQRLEPTGVAAHDPVECLLLQLAELPPSTPGWDCAHALLRRHFGALARTEPAALGRLTGNDLSEVQAALALIRRLDPHPGYRYSTTRIEYLAPDLLAHRDAHGWRVEINPALSPRLRINSIYNFWLADNRDCADGASLAPQLEEARLLIANLAQRETTLLKIGAALVTHQAAFLDSGPAALVPLTLRRVAEELGVHESTVSRAVQAKSLACSRGIIPLRHFFSAALSNIEGDECASARAVQTRIRELIARENPVAPLSDAALAAALGSAGIQVARRTVAKYREALGLASTRERRRLKAAPRTPRNLHAERRTLHQP